MKREELLKMTKADLLALAQRNRIKVSAGMLKADIIAVIIDRLTGVRGSASSEAVRKAKAAAGATVTGKKPAARARGGKYGKARAAGPPAKKITAKKPAAKAAPQKAAPEKPARAKEAASKPAAPKKTVAAGRAKTAAPKAAARKAAPEKPARAKAAAAKPAAPKKPAARKAAPEKPAPRKTAAKPAPPKAAARKPADQRPPAAPHRGWEDTRTIDQKAIAGKYELTSGPVTMPPVESMEIPAGYEVTRIVALTRDPHWIFAYWEITAERFRELERRFAARWTQCTMALRVRDLGAGAHADIGIRYDARNWYINVAPGGRYRVAIGVVTPEGRFVTIAESEIVETPRAAVSEVIDERWIIPDELFERIFAASGGHEVPAGGSAEMRELMEQGLFEQAGSEAVSSFGSGELRREEARARGFRLRVATELILYGATEPDARVTIQGKEIKLRGDGTFTARFALPDGTIDLPVTAVSADGVEERTIETDVRKKSSQKAPVIR